MPKIVSGWGAIVGLTIAMGGGSAIGCGHRAADYGGVAVSAVPLVRTLDRDASIRASSTAVAVIETDIGRGMGFVVDPAGFIITNRHVVEDADHIEAVVFPARDPSRRFESVVVEYVDPMRDLALLRANTDEPLPYLPLASKKDEPVSRYLSRADPVVLLQREGSKDDLMPSLVTHTGKVDRLQVFNPAAGPTPFVGVIADVRQGQSGGPVLDRHGRAVGVVTWTWRDEPGGFAIPISEVARMLATRPRLEDSGARKNRALTRTRKFLSAIEKGDLDGARRLTSPSYARKVREAATHRLLDGEISEGLRHFVTALEGLSGGRPTPKTDDELDRSFAELDRLVATTTDPQFRLSLGAGAQLRDGEILAFFRELGRAYMLARMFGEQAPTAALERALRRLKTVDAARSFAVADATQRVGEQTFTVDHVEVIPGEYAPRAIADVVAADDTGARLTLHLRMEWGDWYVAEVVRTALADG